MSANSFYFNSGSKGIWRFQVPTGQGQHVFLSVYMEMISGEKIETAVTMTGRMQHINVETEGFFVPRVNLGETVQSGNVIGTVQDTIDVISPFDGVLISLSRMNYVFEGDIVARIAPPLGDFRASTQPDVEEPTPVRRKW